MPRDRSRGDAAAATAAHALRELAVANGAPLHVPKAAFIHGPANLPQWTTPEDTARATQLLADEKRLADGFKDPSKKLKHRFKSSTKKERLDQAENWDFTAAERARVLDRLVKGNVESTGLLQAVLEYKGENLLGDSDVASPTSPTSPGSKIIRKVSQKVTGAGGAGEAEEWMVVAVGRGNLDYVRLLVSRGASQQALDSGLREALTSPASPNQLGIVAELVRYGADINQHPELLSKAVDEGRVDIVETCLRGRHRLQPAYLGAALVAAERNTEVKMVALLLSYGADPNYQAAQAFVSAIKADDLRMTSLLLAGAQDGVTVRPQYLDFAIATVVDMRDARVVYAFLEILLCAGGSAHSSPVEDQLFAAVGAGDLNMLELLLGYGASADHGDARCIHAALATQDLATLGVLLRGDISPASLAQAVSQAMAFTIRDQRLQAMKLLLSKGSSGPEVDQALVTAVQQEDSRLFAELLQHGANVDYGNGIAFEAALKARNPAYLQQLCDQGPLSFSTADHVIPIAMHPSHFEESRALYILRASKGHLILLDKSLTDEITFHGSREVVLRMLLDNGASVNSGNGAGLYQAVSVGSARAVQILANAKPELRTLCAAFRAAMNIQEAAVRLAIMEILLDKTGAQKVGQDDALIQEAGNSAYNGTRIVELLLKHDASVDHADAAALKAAISAKSVETTALLLGAHPSQTTLAGAFAACMELPHAPRSWLVRLVADEAAASSTPLDVTKYLTLAIVQGDTALCHLLLHYGADPNSNDGRAFLDAAQLDDQGMFQALLEHQPNISRLLPALIRTLQDEDKLVAVLGVCFKQLKIQPNPRENVLLFLAIDQFEQGQKLVKFLLDAGCSAGAVRELSLRGGEAETVTPLVWALSRPSPGPSKAVIMELLERGPDARPEFVTSVTKTTALLESARSGRHAVLAKLVALADNKVSAQDIDGRSVLLLATESGDVKSVQTILGARVRPNDGSLHAAARSANEQIVNLLLDNGHTPNHIHSGRSALAEFCRNTHPDCDNWSERAYWVVHTLIARGTNIDTKYGGKNLVHLALDNDTPVPVLKILLDFPQFSEHLNDENFLFEDATGTVYSPRSYAEVFPVGPPSETAALGQIFEDKNCYRNMWNRQGRHPPNYTYSTMPAYLKAQLDQEKLDDLQHEKTLRRMQEEARAQQELADRTHAHSLQQSAERNNQLLLEQQQRDAAEALSQQRRHDADARHQRQLAAAQAKASRDRHNLELSQHAALATQRQQIEDRDRERQHQHQLQMNAAAKQLAWDQDNVHKRQHERQMLLIAQQDASVKARADQMARVAGAARQLGAPPQAGQRMLGMGPEFGTVE